MIVDDRKQIKILKKENLVDVCFFSGLFLSGMSIVLFDNIFTPSATKFTVNVVMVTDMCHIFLTKSQPISSYCSHKFILWTNWCITLRQAQLNRARSADGQAPNGEGTCADVGSLIKYPMLMCHLICKQHYIRCIKS